MPSTLTLYTGLVLLVAVERIVELGIARKHNRFLRGRGGMESGSGHYRWMVAMHTAFLAACPMEVWWSHRPFLPFLGYPMLALLGASAGLRVWTLRSLGKRWTTRVIPLPGEPRVVDGPFRYLRHPNYLAVVLEMAALPLVHTAWFTACLFSLLNALMLRVRIPVENAALARAEESS